MNVGMPVGKNEEYGKYGADRSMNQQQSFLCHCIASIEQVKNWRTELKLLRSTTTFVQCVLFVQLPSVLLRCWLGGRKGILPVKSEWWGAGVVICLERGADLHIAQLMPLPLTVSCSSKIQIGFIFLVPAYLGSPGKRAVKRVCVCVCTVCTLLDGH